MRADFAKYKSNDRINNGPLKILELQEMSTNPRYLFTDLSINAYGKVLNEDYKNYYAADTYLLLQLSTTSKNKLSNRQIARIQYKSRRMVFLPLHTNGNHWTLYALSSTNKTVKYYDSCVTINNMNRIIPYSKLIQKFLTMVDLDVEYTITRQSCLQQNNDYDCGVFVCIFIEKLIRGENIEMIKASNMQFYRQYIAYQISRLLDT